jgi:hypothetical protein
LTDIEPTNSDIEISATGQLLDRRRVITPVFIALIISICMNAVGLIGIGLLSQDTNKTVRFVEEQTAPSREERQRQQLDAVLFQIDCNSARRLQRVIDSLSQEGIIANIDITSDCDRTLSQPEDDE